MGILTTTFFKVIEWLWLSFAIIIIMMLIGMRCGKEKIYTDLIKFMSIKEILAKFIKKNCPKVLFYLCSKTLITYKPV